jgi:hypothetical protein
MHCADFLLYFFQWHIIFFDDKNDLLIFSDYTIDNKEWIDHCYINQIEGRVPEWGKEKDKFYQCLSF